MGGIGQQTQGEVLQFDRGRAAPTPFGNRKVEPDGIVDREYPAHQVGADMNLLTRFISWLKWMVKGRRLESEMETEAKFHLESYAADLERKGLSRQEAMRKA